MKNTGKFPCVFCGPGKIVQNWQTEGKRDIRFAFDRCPTAYKKYAEW